MGAEGIIRLLPCIVLVAVGSTDPLGFGLCLAIPPALATLVALRGQHELMTPGPNAPWSELSTNLGLLLGGSLLAQVLSYAPFLGAQLLATSAERVAVADFIVGLFLSRIPILLFQAVQAALLPRLAAQVSAGQTEDFRRGMRNLLLVVSSIGLVGVEIEAAIRAGGRGLQEPLQQFALAAARANTGEAGGDWRPVAGHESRLPVARKHQPAYGPGPLPQM